MACLLTILVVWALTTFGYSFIDSNPWLWFLWVPLGLITTILLFVFWIYCIILPIFYRINPNNKFKIFYTVHIMKFINLLGGVRVKVEGKENLTKEKKVLYVSNHKSQLDPMIIYEAMGNKGPSVAAKSDLWKVKPLVPFLKSFRILKINRSSDREAAKSIVEGIKFMKEGNGVLIFTEGGIKTREVEQMVSIKPGAYKLALKSEAVIQPMAIFGASKICKHKWYHPFITVTVRILPAIPYEEYKDLTTHELAWKVLNIVNANFEHEGKYGVEEEN